MKKIKVLSFILALILILTSTVVYGADESFKLKLALDTGKTTVQRGDTIKINVILESVNADGGIGGYTANFVFDETIFEGVNIDNNGVILVSGADDELEILKEGSVTKEIELKVKDDAILNKPTEIKLENIEGANYSSTTNTINGNSEPLSLTVTEEEQVEKSLDRIEVIKNPNKIEYNEGEKFDPTGMVVVAYYTDGSEKTIYSEAEDINEISIECNNEYLTKDDNNIMISYTEGTTADVLIEITVKSKDDNSQETPDDKKDQEDDNKQQTSTDKPAQTDVTKTDIKNDETKANGKIPQTGVKEIILPIAIVCILLIGSFIGYKKYKGVK